MAHRICRELIRGEIDNRAEGRVTGTLWLAGREEPVQLRLKGNPWRDLAGCLVRFTNPNPVVERACSLAEQQEGVVGDMTASRKVRILQEDSTGQPLGAAMHQEQHWAAAFYLEWFSEQNGRVVVESADYRVEIEEAPTWSMSPAQEEAQRQANEAAMQSFMERLGDALHLPDTEAEEAQDRPTSQVEAEADAEAARMNLLLDRVMARMEREGIDDGEEYERIYREEREKLRIERGEPAPEPLTPEQEAEQARWIEEMNAAAEEALREYEEKGDEDELPSHPLVDHCQDLGIRMYHEVKASGWVPEGAPDEHPLREAVYGVEFASAKLAGALSGIVRREEWPPDPLFAGDTLVRLKKARTYLRDAIAGLDAADEQRLADFDWRVARRAEVAAILRQVETLIAEVRESLE